MKMQLVLIGSVTLIAFVGLSGCDQISNLFLKDADRLVGTWTSDELWTDITDAPITIVFASNNEFTIIFKIDTTNFSQSDGEWELKNGILTLEMTGLITDFYAEYRYQFSDDSRTLTLTDIAKQKSYELRKQQTK